MFRKICALLLLLPSLVLADVVESLEKEVRPVLAALCADCHDADRKKGDVNFDVLAAPGPARHDVFFWSKVREQLRAGTMPPKGKTPLEPAQRETLLRWIQQNEDHIRSQPASPPQSGRTRRMNREEYNNALRDLLGIRGRPGDNFPVDGAGGEGFCNSADTLSLSTLLVENYLSGAQAALAEVLATPELAGRWFAPLPPTPEAASVTARIALGTLLPAAYRRPCTDADFQPLLDIFTQAMARGSDYPQALRLSYMAALASPKFLFLEEQAKPAAGQSVPLTHYDMASRLAILLWSSLPDAELLGLAAAGKLQDDAVLAAQVKRLLADPKARAFTKNFAGQWLRFGEVLTFGGPDRRKYPAYNSALAQSMHDEIFTFCDHLLREGGSLLDCLDSDYSYLNEPLARLYGVPGVSGNDFRKVSWPDRRRGGLTTMSAILATTAYPRRTSPVLRGKWVLEQLLGTPPPPPPPSVGELPRDDRDLKDKTLRQRLEAHRNKPACSGCHTRMDPPGFALENFDSIGSWRDNENGKPIDSAGALSSGLAFNGAEEFRRQLMQEKSLFSRNFSRKLLGYALERALEPTDQPTMLQLQFVLEQNNYRLEPMLISLVKSPLFRSRR